MSVFITGAGGFLGSAIAKAAAERNPVLAMHRPSSSLAYASQTPRVTPVEGDLRQLGGWREALSAARTVIHCAAAAEGDLPTQLAGTVLATENLLSALPPGLERFVHISSFSVYDFGAPGPFGTLDENTAMERQPLRRDAYTQTKLIQERLVREHCDAQGIKLVIIRPGAIYGPGKDWDFGRAMRLGPFDLLFAPMARMRLVHVDDCARTAIAALNAPVESALTVNVVGSEQPTHWAYHRAGRKAGADVGIGVPVPYALVRLLGCAAWLVSRLFFKGRARLPELLDLPRQEARWRPLRYSNARARDELGWQETLTVKRAMPQITNPGT